MILHPKFGEIQAMINPAINQFMAGKVARVPMLQTLKPQVQAIVEGR